MADFCKQCALREFGYDSKDLSGLVLPGQRLRTLCEGCGPAVVNHRGECISDNCLYEHGKRILKLD